MSIDAAWLPKAGSVTEEWEDGFAFSERQGRAAIADGASTSAHAREWATILTAGAITDPVDLADRLAVTGWFARRRSEFAERAVEPSGDAPWYAAEVARRDAYATWLGVTIDGDAAVAAAVGDCALFAIDERDELIASWPAESPDDFGSTPDLVSSAPDAAEATMRSVKRCRINLGATRHLVLTTDAMAEWALAAHRREPDVWRVLALAEPDAVRRLVDDLRAADEIVNDDVTVVRISRTEEI